jgi:predicted DNA-binding protein with PD1-like motif
MVIPVKTAKGKISSILVVRLQRGDDLIGSIMQACEEYGVKNAAIISMVGSLNGATYYDPVINPKVKSWISYADPIFLECPAQILSAHGEICHTEDGKLDIHIHATFADSKGNACGGHLVGEGNQALNTVNIILAIIEGVDMGFEWEDILGQMSFYPKQV